MRAMEKVGKPFRGAGRGADSSVASVCLVGVVLETNDTTPGPDRRLPKITWLVHDRNSTGDPARGGRSPACGA